MAGKQTVAANAETHGLYGSVLRGKDLARLKKVREYTNGAILQSNFEMVQAKLLGVVEGDVRLTEKFNKLYGVAELMAEQGEFEPDDLYELKLRLAGVDLEKIARISATTAGLASQAVAQSDIGNIQAQNNILRSFVIDVLKLSSDTAMRSLAVQVISRLKLEAGLPVEELESLIGMIKEPLEETVEVEDEPEDTAEDIGGEEPT